MIDAPSTEQPDSDALDPILLSVLRCPVTHSPLEQHGDRLVATVGGLSYAIREGIPVMLIEDATLPPGVASLDDLKRKLGMS